MCFGRRIARSMDRWCKRESTRQSIALIPIIFLALADDQVPTLIPTELVVRSGQRRNSRGSIHELRRIGTACMRDALCHVLRRLCAAVGSCTAVRDQRAGRQHQAEPVLARLVRGAALSFARLNNHHSKCGPPRARVPLEVIGCTDQEERTCGQAWVCAANERRKEQRLQSAHEVRSSVDEIPIMNVTP